MDPSSPRVAHFFAQLDDALDALGSWYARMQPHPNHIHEQPAPPRTESQRHAQIVAARLGQQIRQRQLEQYQLQLRTQTHQQQLQDARPYAYGQNDGYLLAGYYNGQPWPPGVYGQQQQQPVPHQMSYTVAPTPTAPYQPAPQAPYAWSGCWNAGVNPHVYQSQARHPVQGQAHYPGMAQANPFPAQYPQRASAVAYNYNYGAAPAQYGYNQNVASYQPQQQQRYTQNGNGQGAHAAYSANAPQYGPHQQRTQAARVPATVSTAADPATRFDRVQYKLLRVAAKERLRNQKIARANQGVVEHSSNAGTSHKAILAKPAPAPRTTAPASQAAENSPVRPKARAPIGSQASVGPPAPFGPQALPSQVLFRTQARIQEQLREHSRVLSYPSIEERNGRVLEWLNNKNELSRRRNRSSSSPSPPTKRMKKESHAAFEDLADRLHEDSPTPPPAVLDMHPLPVVVKVASSPVKH